MQSEELILPTEFQTDPDSKIPFRMLDYRICVYRRHPQKPMRQVVIYLRRSDSSLVQENTFRLGETFHSFQVNPVYYPLLSSAIPMIPNRC
ncbi:hypothetical protein MICAH_4680002 [Microcystis aeruginosa PCC 9809]|uniref:Uncharacterized protein n=1 Tax=Microcystis aeruginosa PCC 9809 TaxID=1160285 RepID=I4I0P7_MICAE|nr:hypothetical protein MICAH_4680002 [Microcystis aeruginosa PCC 9809]